MPAAGSSSSTNAGLADKRAGEFEPPLLAECEIGGQFVALVRKIEEFERAVDLGAGAARAAEPAAQETFLAGAARRNSARPRGSARRSIARTGGCSGTCAQSPGHARVRRQRRKCPRREDSTRPAVGGNSPQIRLTIVLLPEPFGPIRPRISPLRDREIDAVDRAHAAEMLGEALELKHRRAPCCGRSSRLSASDRRRHRSARAAARSSPARSARRTAGCANRP